MKKQIKLLLIVLFGILIFSNAASAADPKKIEVFVFLANTNCSYCDQVKNYLTILSQKQYPDMIPLFYNVSEGNNYQKFQYYTNAYKNDATLLPVTFIGDQAIVGYDPEAILSTIKACLADPSCPNPEKYMTDNYVAPQKTLEGFIFSQNRTYFALGVAGFILIAALVTLLARRR